MPGKEVDSGAGGAVGFDLRKKVFDAPPADTWWLRVLHQVFILTRTVMSHSFESCHRICIDFKGGKTMGKTGKFSADRRRFLKGAAVAGAATLATPTAMAQNQSGQP